MTRKKLSEEDLAAMPATKRDATLRKRAQRARARGEAPPLPPKSGPAKIITLPTGLPAPSAADDLPWGVVAGTLCAEIYVATRAAIQKAGKWNEAAMAPTLVTYAKASELIAANSLVVIPAAVLTAQRQSAAALALHELPADKVVKRNANFADGW